MSSLTERIVERLQHLPGNRLREVLDFVEFLTWRGSSQGQNDPLLSVAGTLSGKMLSAEEIEEELRHFRALLGRAQG
jgi:hypothetical protein